MTMTSVDDAYEAFRAVVSPDADPGATASAFFRAGWDARDRALGGSAPHHIVDVKADGSWTMQHPLDERADGNLFNCAFHPLVSAGVEQGHVTEGRFSVTLDAGAVLWTEI